MGRHHRLMTWSFLLILGLLIYQNVLINAASLNIEDNNLDLRDRLSKVEAHDRHQDGEISLLKIALNEERKVVHDLTSRIEFLENSSTILGRPKRPVRLLPPYLFHGKEKSKNNDEENIHRFYGPATGCNDLGRLGYTLNGFYLVHAQENQSSIGHNNNHHQIEVVQCRFLQKPKLENQTAEDKETRLGFIRIFDNNNGNSKHQSEVKGGNCLYQLKNNRQVCLAVAESKSGSSDTTTKPGSHLVQLPCESKKEEQQWKMIEGHVCSNKNDKCLTLSQNSERDGMFVTLTAYEASAKHQQWRINLTSNGLVVIKNGGVAPLCLVNPANGNEKNKLKVKEGITQLQRCESNSGYNFFLELVIEIDRPNCIPIEHSYTNRKTHKNMN